MICVIQPFNSNLFDLVIGFQEMAPPTTVEHFISSLAITLAIGGVQSTKTGSHPIWDLVCSTVDGSQAILDSTPVVVLFQADGKVFQRAICKHTPTRPFGFEFKACRNNCTGERRIVPKMRDGFVRLVCLQCNWVSAKVPYDCGNAHFVQLRLDSPRLFWHHFPAGPSLHTMFIDESL